MRSPQVLLSCLLLGCVAAEPGRGLLLGAAGVAGPGRTGPSDSQSLGWTFSIGGEVTEYVDLTGRVSAMDNDTDDAIPGYSPELRARELFLDGALRVHVPVTGESYTYRNELRPYLDMFVGYGFLATADDRQETAEGPSWGVGMGLEYHLNPVVRLEGGLEYRKSTWHVDLHDDFGQQDLMLRISMVVRLPDPHGPGLVRF